ncbi:MAG TPA: hypothetical protein PKC21_00915 [Oligoflexia bacterium]|nr:hypothetical protein [Oligoflexia bacterium]HMR23890.1 hypothetical protein [Oligoflexia bacterium]
MKMKILKQQALFLLVFLFVSCGGKGGSLMADLITTGMSNPENIDKFIATVSSPGADNLFYPSSCLECDNGSSNCDAGDKCVAQNCGFDPSGPFSLDITFGSFPKGSTVQVTVCALDNTPQFIGFAQSNAVNADGELVLLTMQNDSGGGDCSQWMPPLCS